MKKRDDNMAKNEPAPDASASYGPAEGLTCRECGCHHFFVVDTRRSGAGIRRRRECRNCGRLVWTREEVSPSPPELED